MIKSIKVRLEPNNKQSSKMFESSNVARWAYNFALSEKIESYKTDKSNLNEGEIRKLITKLKKVEEYTWISNVSAQIPKQAVKDCDKSFKAFFKGLSKFPKFKSKRHSKPSFYNDCQKIKFSDSKVLLERIGWVKISEKNKIPQNLKSYTNPRITFDGLNWYISVGIEHDVMTHDIYSQGIGVDLGLKDFAIVSNIDKPFKSINKNIRVKRIEKRLKQKQRKATRQLVVQKLNKEKSRSNNCHKTYRKINVLYKRLSNIRLNNIHQITNILVKNKPKYICVEDLNVNGMMKNRHLSKAIHKSNFTTFLNILKYKCELNNIVHIKANRWYPSSKTCNHCGQVKSDLKLKDRLYKCECGYVEDRDKNASYNLRDYGLAQISH